MRKIERHKLTAEAREGLRLSFLELLLAATESARGEEIGALVGRQHRKLHEAAEAAVAAYDGPARSNPMASPATVKIAGKPFPGLEVVGVEVRPKVDADAARRMATDAAVIRSAPRILLAEDQPDDPPPLVAHPLLTVPIPGVTGPDLPLQRAIPETRPLDTGPVPNGEPGPGLPQPTGETDDLEDAPDLPHVILVEETPGPQVARHLFTARAGRDFLSSQRCGRCGESITLHTPACGPTDCPGFIPRLGGGQ